MADSEGKKTVLLIDDEASFVKVIAWKLEQKGFDILTAEDGVVGLETAQANKPDLILLDFMLPKLNGLLVLEKLKADSETAHIPVIVMTAAIGSDQKMQELMDKGALQCITKPYDLNELLAIIHALFDAK